MGPGKVSAREETDRLRLARIRRVKNRDSVAEHVADIKMPAVEHDLNTVRPAPNIAVGQVTKAFFDAFRRDGTFLRSPLTRTPGQRCATKETFPAIAPSDRGHVS